MSEIKSEPQPIPPVFISNFVRSFDQETEVGTYSERVIDPSRYLDTKRFKPEFGFAPTLAMLGALRYGNIIKADEVSTLYNAMYHGELIKKFNNNARQHGTHIKGVDQTVLALLKSELQKGDVRISPLKPGLDGLEDNIRQKITNNEAVVIITPDVSFFLAPPLLHDKRKDGSTVERVEIISPFPIGVADKGNRFQNVSEKYHVTPVPDTENGLRFKISINKIKEALSKGKTEYQAFAVEQSLDLPVQLVHQAPTGL